MDNINIAALFSHNDGSKVYIGGGGKLDTNTLFSGISITGENECSFDSKTLLVINQNKQRNLTKWYNNMYIKCCEKIKASNAQSLTDIICEIPKFVPECPEFSSKDCLKFIKTKLHEQLIKTHIISDCAIFVTWHDLEQKYNEQK